MRARTDLPLRLVTLGSSALCVESTGEVLLGPGKLLALFVFLRLAPGGSASRESLINLLWSDVDPDKARNALRQAIYNLRRLVGDEAITGTEELTLVQTIASDRDEFLAALESGDLASGIGRYAGDFLPAFGVPGGAAFEQWADLERDRLRGAYMRTAELLVRRWLNESRVGEARQLARRVRDLLPDVEAAGRLVLEASISGHDFVTAAMEADLLEESAREDGTVLQPATRAAIARARRVAPTATPDERASHALVAELTGREQEFFAITSAWDAVRSGAARHLHISAPAGLGKTRLLRDVVARLSAGGAAVVSMRAAPGDRDVPYAFVSDLAAALVERPGAAGIAPASAATLIALNPTLSTRLTAPADPAVGDEMLRRRILALSDLMHSVADEQRFVLAIDDLHWVDAPSLRVLEGLWSRLTTARVLTVTAARPERVPDAERCVVLPLAPLTKDQVGTLVSALAIVPPNQPWAAQLVPGLYDATRGSPLLVLETLRFALDDGVLALEHNQWRCLDATRLPALLRAGEALRERVRVLPDQQLWPLALLAVAGTPMERNALAEVSAAEREVLSARLDPLERQGLISRSPGGWALAHDEIALAALDALGPARTREAEQAIGRYWALSSGDDVTGMLRAVRHLLAAGDDGTVQQIARRYAARARARGDDRPFTAVVAELLGERATAAQVAAVVGTLPPLWRMGLWSASRQAIAAAALLVLPLGAVLVQRERAAAAAVSQRLVFVDSTKAVRAVTVGRDAWPEQTAALEDRAGDSPFVEPAMAHAELPPAISPDGRSVAWTQDSGDSTTLDIWLRTPSGTRRLTKTTRDDLVTEWLPDGSGLLGMTDRWTRPGSLGYDIAVFDTATGAARPVTQSDDHDGNAVASLDGTRAAFVRTSDEFPPQVCVTALDGRTEPECREVSGQPSGGVVGWIGLDELLLILQEEDGQRPLIAYDWARNRRRDVLGPYVVNARLSPDHRWASASVRATGGRGLREWVVPLDRPSEARAVTGGPRGAARWWEGRADTALVIRRLEFADTVSTVPLGIGTRLLVNARNAANTDIPLRAPLRWRSTDTLVATVDSLGEIHPLSAGIAEITASLGAWRTPPKRVRVVGAAPTAVLDERWDATWRDRWISWGDPKPQVVTGPQGIRGFWNHGDGIYPSFGTLRQALSARNGLGAELRLSTPFTAFKWQRLSVLLYASGDTTALVRADQSKSPPALGPAAIWCGLDMPGDGKWAADRVFFPSAIQGLSLGAEAAAIRSGQWWTLRLQILPDGRCGVALNGRVLGVSSEPLPLDGEFRLHLGNESAGTQLLVGPTQVWTGVRTDMEWVVKR